MYFHNKNILLLNLCLCLPFQSLTPVRNTRNWVPVTKAHPCVRCSPCQGNSRCTTQLTVPSHTPSSRQWYCICNTKCLCICMHAHCWEYPFWTVKAHAYTHKKIIKSSVTTAPWLSWKQPPTHLPAPCPGLDEFVALDFWFRFVPPP